MTPDKLIATEEAARILGCRVETVSWYARRWPDALPRYKSYFAPHWHYRYRLSDVLAFAASRRKRGRPRKASNREIRISCAEAR